MEQTANKIIVRDLVNLEETPIKTLISRMDIIVKTMLSDSNESIKTNYDSNNLYIRDLDVNRLHYLAFKVIRAGLNDPKIAKRLNKTPVQLVDAWLLITHLERIGDEAKRITSFFNRAKPKGTELTKLIEIYSSIEKLYRDAMKAYYNLDKKLADVISFNVKTILEQCDNFLNKHNNPNNSRIIQNLKSMQVSIRAIARIVENEESAITQK